jgi:hypothetical protein
VTADRSVRAWSVQFRLRSTSSCRASMRPRHSVGYWDGSHPAYDRSWSTTAPQTAPAYIARDHGAQVVCAPQRGYGAASHAGLLAAVASVVAVMDADASLNPQQLDRVVAPHHRRYGRSRRRQPSPSQCRSLPMALRLANRELARRVGRRTGLMIADLREPLPASRSWRCKSRTDGLATRSRP